MSSESPPRTSRLTSIVEQTAKVGPPTRRVSRLDGTDARASDAGRPSLIRPSLHSDSNTSYMRRESVAQRDKMSINRRPSNWRRPSTYYTDRSHDSRTILLENTYRMQPEAHQVFRASAVEPILEEMLQSYLDGEKYDAMQCAKMSTRVSEIIRDRIKEMKFPRYKLVCHVIIGQNNGQCFTYASRSVWDDGVDNYATSSYKNASLFAIATVFAVYLE